MVEEGMLYFKGRMVDIMEEEGRNNVERRW